MWPVDRKEKEKFGKAVGVFSSERTNVSCELNENQGFLSGQNSVLFLCSSEYAAVPSVREEGFVEISLSLGV